MSDTRRIVELARISLGKLPVTYLECFLAEKLCMALGKDEDETSSFTKVRAKSTANFHLSDRHRQARESRKKMM